MSGKILIQWRHSLCAEIARTRYSNPERTRAVHTEIANIFFNPADADAGDDSGDGDDTSSQHSRATKSGTYTPHVMCMHDIYSSALSSRRPELSCA